MKYYSGLWKIKSKGAILTLVLHFLVSCACFTFYILLTEITYNQPAAVMDVYIPVAAGLVLSAVVCPLAGWLADVYYGKYKVLRFGLFAMWVGALSIAVTTLLADKFEDCERCRKILYYTGGLVGIIIAYIGLSAYVVNAVQFGIDQMPEASADELIAYIHWLVWAILAGLLCGNLTSLIRYCVPVARHNGYVAGEIQLLVPVAMLSLALFCEFLLHHWLIIEPRGPNALKNILGVLKFAATHRYALRRRAITYTEDVKPSRIDFAKEKYGGPYTTEQVEDVKTVFRIIVVIASTTTLAIPLFLFVDSFGSLEYQASNDVCIFRSQHLIYSPPFLGVVMIPLYTTVIYPTIRKRMLSTARVAIAAALLVVLCGAMLTVDSIKHAVDPNISCMFSSSSSAQIIKLDLWIVIPLNFLIAIEVLLFTTAILEFVCAQSPYHMRGLLFGLLKSFICFALPIAFTVWLAWNGFQLQIPPSCDFYYFLFQFLCAVAGLILLCVVARWYKRRQREEEDDQRRIVEGVYDRMLRYQSENHDSN